MPRIALFGGVSARAFGANGSFVEPGQTEWSFSGSYSFVVPARMTRLCGVVIGGGGDNTGSGGALHWRNDIPVVPGETLTIQVGTGGRLSGLPIETYVKRGSTYLLRATHTSYYPTLGGGGGDGGAGSPDGSPIGSRGAGGAGGYMGRGGNGGSDTSNAPPAGSGGGMSGSTGDGQGVGLQGRTADFAPGSRGTPQCGGGCGEGQQGGVGGVRFMWGRNRSFPDAAIDV